MTPVRASIAALAFGLLLTACASPIVGAECKKGFTRCDGVCVDLEKDPAHCGECGHDCGKLECSESSCGPGPRPDLDGGVASPADGGGGTSGSGGRDGGPGKTPGSVGSPFLPDGGLTFPDPMVGQGCGLGETDCGGVCAVLSVDHAHCGMCGNACPADQFCSAGECKDICEDPLVLCNGQCVDLQTSVSNCGSCGNVCASGICEDGACEDVVPGQLVVFGHDYSGGGQVNTTMKRLAGNALFLARGAPVRTLVYRGMASDAVAGGVAAAFDYVVAVDGRRWTQIDAHEDLVPHQLHAADAFVILAQDDSDDERLEELGQRWGLAITQFLLRGGVVLVFETDSTANSGTYKLLRPSGLFDADSRVSIARQTLTVVSPGIGVATRTTRSYRSATNTAHFLDVTTPGTVVVEDRDAEAVIVHRIISL